MSEVRKLALGHWPAILMAAGVPDCHLIDVHTECPICGSSGKAWFRFDNLDDRGTYFCNQCGSGDGIQFLMAYRDWNFHEAANFVERYLGSGKSAPALAPRRVSQSTQLAQRAEQRARWTADLLRTTYRESIAVSVGDPVWLHLTQVRPLLSDIKSWPGVIRYHRGLEYKEAVLDDNGKPVKKDGQVVKRVVGVFPTMLSLVQGPDGRGVCLHRTFLTKDGQKAPVAKPKQLMPSLGCDGGAIRLLPAQRRMGVAEGIETAIAASLMHRMPVWATVSSTIMKGWALPAGVEELTVFADNDAPDQRGKRAGQDASAELIARLTASTANLRVKEMLPPEEGTDFYDVFMGKTRAAEKEAA